MIAPPKISYQFSKYIKVQINYQSIISQNRKINEMDDLDWPLQTVLANQAGTCCCGKNPHKSHCFHSRNITYDTIPLNSFMELQTSSTDNHILHAKIIDELGNVKFIFSLFLIFVLNLANAPFLLVTKVSILRGATCFAVILVTNFFLLKILPS